MSNPWDIYSVLWQSGSFLTVQNLNESDKREDNIRNFFFSNSILKYQWGINNIKIDLSQLPIGIIKLKKISCIFPNGEIFIYDDNWKIINNEDPQKVSSTEDNIYTIEFNCNDFGSLFLNKTYVEIGLILQENSFGQNIYTPIVSEIRDPNNPEDINNVFKQIVKTKFIVSDINKNKNFLPLIRIAVKNGVYKIMDYQYPIPFVYKNTVLGGIISDFVEKLFKRINYIGEENKIVKNNNNLSGFIQSMMGTLFLLKSSLFNETLTPYDLYSILLKALGELESFSDFYFINYSYYHNDLLLTMEQLTKRISIIIEDIYEIGEFCYFHESIDDNNLYILDIDLKGLENKQIFLDIKASDMDNIQVNDWVENSIITFEDDFEKNKMNKTRGFARELISSQTKETNENIITSSRYLLTIPMDNAIDNVNLFLFNPRKLDKVTIVLIKRNITY